MTEWWEDLYLCDVFDESFQKQIKDNIFLAKLLWSFKVFASVNQLHDKFCAFKKYFSLKKCNIIDYKKLLAIQIIPKTLGRWG